MPKFTPCTFCICSIDLGVPQIGRWISLASKNAPHIKSKHITSGCCGRGTPRIIFSGPPEGHEPPSGDLLAKLGSTGGKGGGSGVAVPIGEPTNKDGGSECNGDCALLFASGVNSINCSEPPTPNEGCEAPFCASSDGTYIGHRSTW